MNGYKESKFDKMVKRARLSNVKQRKSTQENIISLPYVKGLSEKLSRILKKRDIKVAFPPPNTIRRIVDATKYLVDLIMHKGVYSIPFSYDKVYIRKTGRSMKIRFKEHNADLRLNRI